MAFKDLVIPMYDGDIVVTYKDAAHRYYVQQRGEDGELGKKTISRGVTTILGDTLEKKGLMTWPLGLAMKELFGFYDFTNERGEHMVGFSKKNGGGTLISASGGLTVMGKDKLLPAVSSANKAWTRKQAQGADVGSIVHAAIEGYITDKPFEITLERYKENQVFETSDQEAAWLEIAPAEVEMANLAFNRFVKWWKEEANATVVGVEELVYSREMQYCGAFDAILTIDGKTVLTDWKSSNASANAGAPEGVYYSYFIQSAAYAAAWEEMGNGLVDDLLIVSCRKDGNFNTKYASELGLSVRDAIDWWKAVVLCYKMMKQTKEQLVATAKEV